MAARAPAAARALDPAILPLLRELGDLKRVHSARRDGSIATRLFEAGWSAWLDGVTADAVAYGPWRRGWRRRGWAISIGRSWASLA
jgi:hypothetical protein